MNAMVPDLWIYIAAGVVALLLVLWLILGRKRPARERSHRPDVLDEGVGPAKRNQALIDAPSATAAALAATGPDIFAGAGEAVAMGAAEEVATATAVSAALDAREADDLTRIKGVGPKLVAALRSLGIVRYAQIAAWTDEDLDRLDSQLGPFTGRPRKDGWVEQATYLAKGDTAGFEARFGKL